MSQKFNRASRVDRARRACHAYRAGFVRWTGICALLSAVLIGCDQGIKSTLPLSTSSSTSARIIDGRPVAVDDPIAKMTVSIKTIKRGAPVEFCTGVLIHRKIVLSAAHCFNSEPDSTFVVFHHDADVLSGETVRTVLKVVFPPSWNKVKRKDRGDLALLRLLEPAPMGAIATQPLPIEESIQLGDEVILAGFGATEVVWYEKDGAVQTEKKGVGLLRRIKSRILGAASSSELLVDGESGGICYGDSGGPAFIERKGQLYLLGIASGVSSADCHGFGVHTFVLAHGAWITDASRELLKR